MFNGHLKKSFYAEFMRSPKKKPRERQAQTVPAASERGVERNTQNTHRSRQLANNGALI